MTGLRAALADYLALRRALGYKLAADERLLRQFLGFMKANDATVITTALALKWAALPSVASPGWLSQRLSPCGASPPSPRAWTRRPRSRRPAA